MNVFLSKSSVFNGGTFGNYLFNSYDTGLNAQFIFGTPVVSLGLVISPSSLLLSFALGNPSMNAGSAEVMPASSTANFSVGNPSCDLIVVVISPTGISQLVGLGNASLSPGDVSIAPVGFDVSTSFGTAVVLVMGQTLPYLDIRFVTTSHGNISYAVIRHSSVSYATLRESVINHG